MTRPESAEPGSTRLEALLESAAREWNITPRERAVLRAIVLGNSNKEIARELDIHEGSVERHATALLRKSGCDSRTRLVATFWMRE